MAPGQKDAPSTAHSPGTIFESITKRTHTRGLLHRVRTGNLMPVNLTEEIVRNIFNTRAKERNTDATITQFVQQWQANCKELGFDLPRNVIRLVEAQTNTTLRFGRLDLNGLPKILDLKILIETCAKACVEVPVVRTILISKHPQLTNTKTVQCLINAMERQLTRWTTMIPLSVQKRRRRASILLEQRVKERIVAMKKKTNNDEEYDDEDDGNREKEDTNENKQELAENELLESSIESMEPANDMYLSGVAKKIEPNGMPIFLLQEIELAESEHHLNSLESILHLHLPSSPHSKKKKDQKSTEYNRG